MRIERLFAFLCLSTFANADLRMASWPHGGYFLRNQGTVPWATRPASPDLDPVAFRVPVDELHYRYMIPSTFNYKGLLHQKTRNYDNFLRSNIDNEQDNRNFNDEDGKDHLPFRTMETEVFDNYKQYHGRGRHTHHIFQKWVDYNLSMVVKPGDSVLVPLRWNNPHASEMEINVWIFEHASKQPVVVPIRKPSCSGEGHQDNIVSFTVPADFAELGDKIPGFHGCNADSKPMCTLQMYSHSVESRTYAIGVPLVVLGHDKSRTSTSSNGIREASKDPWLDLSALRDICLPATDPSAMITSAQPRWARLVSDVFNHAYQNSDYSPYSGQQHELISKNLQASAINKMVTGNRGELGKIILTGEQRHRLRYLHRLENGVYKNYEALANNIIKQLGNKMTNTGKIGVQQLATCFRCKEVGSTNTKRQQTNTYIPSFQLPDDLVAGARKLVPEKYAKLITESGLVQIYVASMNDLLPFFYDARSMGIIYQDAVVKSTISTMIDATNFKKRDANGTVDGGVYAATQAKKAFVAERGCPSHCLYAQPNFPDKKVMLLDMEGQDDLAKKSPCDGSGVQFSDSFIQIGKWRLGDADGLHLSLAHKDGKTPVLWRFDGKVHANTQGFSTWPRSLGSPRGIYFGDRFIQIGKFRVGDADGRHFLVEHTQGLISQIYRNDGRIFNGPRKDVNGNTLMQRSIGKAAGISIGKNFIQIGEWRLGDVDGAHFSVSHKSKRTSAIYRNDGRGFPGPRRDFHTWSTKVEKTCAEDDTNKQPDADQTKQGAWFCVPNLHKKFVKGPFLDVGSAKRELNKNPAKDNVQMICEMSVDGVASDWRMVGGQIQTTNNGFETNLHGRKGLQKLQHMCNAFTHCRFNLPADSIEKPLLKGSIATDVSGPCAQCVQFFGKKVHPMTKPPTTDLASDIMKAGEDGAVPSATNALPGNPDNAQSSRNRRRRRNAQGLSQISAAASRPSSRRRRRGR